NLLPRLGHLGSPSSPCPSTFPQEIALHQLSVFGSGRGRIGFLAHAVVHGKGVFPKLLGKRVVALRLLECRQHNFDQRQKLRIIDGWPLILTSKHPINLHFAELDQERQAVVVHAVIAPFSEPISSPIRRLPVLLVSPPHCGSSAESLAKSGSPGPSAPFSPARTTASPIWNQPQEQQGSAIRHGLCPAPCRRRESDV